MDYRQFKDLLDTGVSGKEDLAGLQEFVNEFPYFQTAHALLAKAMHESNHVRYEKQLKLAAAYSGDRKSLYNLIHRKSAPLFKETVEASVNPFIAPVISETPVKEESFFADATLESVIPETEENMMEIENAISPPPVVTSFREETELPTQEISDDFEMPAEDPHEIIRRRLNEILGSSVERVESETEKENFRNEIESLEEPPLNIVPEKNDDIIEQIADESQKALDDIDKGELEYALEASLIQSLERLPVIEKEKKQPVEEIKQSEERTFFSWLKTRKVEGYGYVEEVHAYETEIPAFREEKAEPVVDKVPDRVDHLIDRFIQTEPRIVPSKAEFYSPATQAKRSVTEDEDLVSETLARIYRQQGNLIKARASYKKLSLLFPEKLAYFAALISEIDKEINNLDKKDL